MGGLPAKMTPTPAPDLQVRVGDRVARTTCYMCACRCGISVHLKDDPSGTPRVSYIEGNRDHPVNRGVLCAKGAAGIMQIASPARLRAPLRRTGPRGSGQFEEITWEEALATAVSWMKPLRETAPHKLAFFTGRDQSQSLTAWWAQQFGTPNYAAHGGFCSVNMAAGGIYTLGGAFWEFGQPDWERTELFLLFGVAEDHDSNPIKIGIGQLKARGASIVGINPIRTGYNAVADDWYGITPGSDGLLVMSLIHLLLKSGKIDAAYLSRWTNAGCFVGPDGLLLRDGDGKLLVVDRATGAETAFDAAGVRPHLGATLTRDGHTCRTVFHHIAERYLSEEYAPAKIAARTGLTEERIHALAARIADAAFGQARMLEQPWTDFRGERHETFTIRPVAIHAMRGVSAHCNGFQTARAIHLLQALIGSVEAPGGFRFKPPYPKPPAAHPRPHAASAPNSPLKGPPLGFPLGPEDLAIDAAGQPLRIDKAFSWEHPLAVHGMMHMVIANAHAGDPYEIDTLFLYMANMAWNSSMNTAATMEMLTDTREDGEYKIPHIIYSDAYSSEMVAYADLILPDTTYLERHDCISLLDRPICEADHAADAIRWPVIPPTRDGVDNATQGVRGFQSVILDLGARLGLPGFVTEDGAPAYADYADYIERHERKPGIGPLMGFRGDGTAAGRGAPNPGQIQRYIDNGGVFVHDIPPEARFMKPWNAAYQDWAVATGLYDAPQPYLLELWSEPLRRFQRAAEGEGDRQPPEHLRPRLARAMDPLPTWWEIPEHEGYPVHALTQRPMAMYHSWGSQNAWLRQIHGQNALYVPLAIWQAEGFSEGDWARLTSPSGEIVVPAAPMAALNAHTVWTWNAIGKRRGAWALDPEAKEATSGFLLNHLIPETLQEPPAPGVDGAPAQAVPSAALRPAGSNRARLSNSDPVTGQAAWFDLRVRIERVPAAEVSLPRTGRQQSPVGRGPEHRRPPQARPGLAAE
ncbi:MAG: molybdopterin-dependent oxidoreductase [Pseudomonadota bacterium]